MSFDPDEAAALLSRTPATLRALLLGLPEAWTGDAPPGVWNPRVVVGHLIHGEETDWIPRARIILEHGEARPFEPFDRFAQLDRFRSRPLPDLLERFAELRTASLIALREMSLRPEDWDRRGVHPELGGVTMRELIATWVVHDLNHLRQIATVMASRYADSVGPWKAYLPILSR